MCCCCTGWVWRIYLGVFSGPRLCLQVIERVKQTKTSVARVLSRVDSDGSGDLDILELQVGAVKPCTTDIYLHHECAHVG